jgi:hypothetical protein
MNSKKLLLISLILVLVLAMSVFSLSAFAVDTKTETLFDAIENNEEVTVSFRTGKSDTFGESYSVQNTVYMDDDKIAYDFDNGFFKLRTITDDGKLVSFLPSFPFVHMTLADLSLVKVDIWGIIEKLSNFTMDFLVFQNSYETTIDGVTYYVEEFNDRGSVVNSFYYVGDELKVLKAQDFAKKTIQYTYFDEVKSEADSSVFQRPLISFELTVVLSFILMIFGNLPTLPVV